MTSIPTLGEEASFPLDIGGGLTVRHGSSLSLMTNVCSFLGKLILRERLIISIYNAFTNKF